MWVFTMTGYIHRADLFLIRRLTLKKSRLAVDLLAVKVMKNSCINRSDAEDHDSGGLAHPDAVWVCRRRRAQRLNLSAENHKRRSNTEHEPMYEQLNLLLRAGFEA
ncbi:uncharacterized [Tachysurus ichikawai]